MRALCCRFTAITEYVVQSLEPPRYLQARGPAPAPHSSAPAPAPHSSAPAPAPTPHSSAPAPAPTPHSSAPASRSPAHRPCTYCTTSHHHTTYKEHLVTAHADLLFHCEECDKYIDRKDFILHMSLHAVQYTSGNDKKDIKRRKVRKKKEETDVNQNMSDVTNKTDTGIVQELDDSKENQDNEFSDHSDMEYGFGPLPESVFEAIEDSQDSQPLEEHTSQTPENERLSDESNKSSALPSMENSNLSNVSNCAIPSVESGDISSPALETNDLNNDPPVENNDSKTKGHKRTRTCPICSKVYTASSSYFYHMKYFHKRSREHECEICRKKFGTKASLTEHTTIHTGECKFECKECHKRFRSKASLYIHEQTHNGIKSWSCTQCHRSFRWRTHLLRHMKRHSAEKGHICATCGRGFSIRCDLLRHARTHSAGDFTCDKCGQKCAQLRYLKVHMVKKHSANVIKESQ